MRRLTAFCILAIPVVVIAASRPVPQELTDTDVAAIRAVIDDHGKAMIAGDIEAVMANFDEQAVEIFGNEVSNIGKPNIRKRFQGFMPNYDYTGFEINTIDIIGYGSFATAVTSGSQSYHFRGAEELITVEVISARILKKQEDGSWKILVNHFINY